VLAF
jgi:lysophospholipase